MHATEHSKAHHTKPPNAVYAVAELPRALFELLSLLPAHLLLARAPRGDGHPVVTLPGYRASDSSMNIMRSYLERWGYDPHPWGLGTNLGVGNDRVNYEDRFVDVLERIVDHSGEPATLIGWSQGGVIARQAAKARPELVRHVVTMGSPIADTPEATTIWRIFRVNKALGWFSKTRRCMAFAAPASIVRLTVSSHPIWHRTGCRR